MNIFEYVDAMNKLFWYSQTPEEQERLKDAVKKQFQRKPMCDTDKQTFACKQGIGG